MTIYAERWAYALRQVVIDIGVVAWCVLAFRVGTRARETIGGLATPGARIERTGDRFATNFDRVADQVPDLPFVGDALRVPFTSLADAGRGLEAAGQSHQEAVASLAAVLGVVVVVLLVGWALLRYLPWRTGWIREASAAVRLRDEGADLRLFAHRAVANRPLRELRRAVGDPGAALAADDYVALAELELRSLGLRTTGRAAA
jgi:hypothetical protein